MALDALKMRNIVQLVGILGRSNVLRHELQYRSNRVTKHFTSAWSYSRLFKWMKRTLPSTCQMKLLAPHLQYYAMDLYGGRWNRFSS